MQSSWPNLGGKRGEIGDLPCFRFELFEFLEFARMNCSSLSVHRRDYPIPQSSAESERRRREIDARPTLSISSDTFLRKIQGKGRVYAIPTCISRVFQYYERIERVRGVAHDSSVSIFAVQVHFDLLPQNLLRQPTHIVLVLILAGAEGTQGKRRTYQSKASVENGCAGFPKCAI
jgi:hypothetical protein